MHKQLEHRVVHPSARRYRTPLLLLHGAWHGAWCWRAALDDFAARGFEAHAISLRGHGTSDAPRSINLCRLGDYVRDLATAVGAISPRPVVVGHSMGGAVLWSYLQTERLPGAVLLCTAPSGGTLRFLSDWVLRHPLAGLRALLTLNARHLVGTPRLAREAFFRPDIAPGDLELYAARMVPEALLVALQISRPAPRWAGASTPTLVIAAERDRVFTVEEQRATAADCAAELVVVPDAAHDLMLDPAWPVAAAAIERAVARWER